MNKFPGYTISLVFWIIPDIIFFILFHTKLKIGSIQKKSMYINLAIFTIIGFVLDILFAKKFFIFPNDKMIIGIKFSNIPIEEFIFYFTGFLFIILMYIFLDEYFLKKYNKPDYLYQKFSKKLKRRLYLNLKKRSVLILTTLLIPAFILKFILNSNESYIPGYYIYLSLFAYLPYILFSRITKKFINWRALIFTILITTLISVIWEVTMAIPYGFWGYSPKYMIGIFIPFWYNLPIEAVTVWLFSSLIIFVYEFTKITFFKNSDFLQKRN